MMRWKPGWTGPGPGESCDASLISRDDIISRGASHMTPRHMMPHHKLLSDPKHKGINDGFGEHR
jgi:hypothetical protein